MSESLIKAIVSEFIEAIELEKGGERELTVTIMFKTRQRRELAYRVIKREAKKVGVRVVG